MAKASQPQRFTITARDVAILQSLHDARYLTVEQLEWLHFPSWQERWQQAQASGKKYIASAQLYSRLRRMEEAGFIRRIVRPVMLAVSTYKRDADVWMLGTQGAAVLAEYGGVDPASLHVQEPRVRSFITLTHSAEIGRVYAALRTKTESTSGLQMDDWRNDYDTAQDYDRITATVPQKGGGTAQELLPVQPDGAFLLRHANGAVLCLVEVERDRPPQSWMQKVYAWEAYTGSAELQHRYGQQNFLVLAFSLNDTARHKLMEATAQAVYDLYGGDEQRMVATLGRYLFAALPDAHPTTIGTCWQRISGVSIEQKHGPGGGVYERVAIEASDHAFIRY